MPSPILARADALMHRKRQPETELDDVPVLIDALDDDDIPVLLDELTPETGPEASSAADPRAFQTAIEAAPLTDIEIDPVMDMPEMMPGLAVPSGSTEALTARETPEPPPRLINADLREQLASELARRVEQRLVAELPRLIESTLRDFLAEQEMIAASTSDD
ncbi:hypothetical protein [Dechloromonas agitata]|uniref:hypothetical protein n=1 Tax=Dechloromonas agitata TaxID=73030 RepID=UPI000481E6AC|nr:hypothetical protein [Dechloromonas agitata]